MNELENTQYIIEQRYYCEMFDAIANYFKENTEAFLYDGSDGYPTRWFEIALNDYRIIEVYFVVKQEIKIMDMVVVAELALFDKYRFFAMC